MCGLARRPHGSGLMQLAPGLAVSAQQHGLSGRATGTQLGKEGDGVLGQAHVAGLARFCHTNYDPAALKVANS